MTFRSWAYSRIPAASSPRHRREEEKRSGAPGKKLERSCKCNSRLRARTSAPPSRAAPRRERSSRARAHIRRYANEFGEVCNMRRNGRGSIRDVRGGGGGGGGPAPDPLGARLVMRLRVALSRRVLPRSTGRSAVSLPSLPPSFAPTDILCPKFRGRNFFRAHHLP